MHKEVRGGIDRIDMEVLMDSETFLKIQQRQKLLKKDLRALLNYSITFQLIEFLIIFFVGGFAILVTRVAEDARNQWIGQIGPIFVATYLVLWVMDHIIFLTMRIELFKYSTLIFSKSRVLT